MNESIIDGQVKSKNIQFYRENGYLIAKDLFDDQYISRLNEEAILIVKGKRGEVEGLLSNSSSLTDEDALKTYPAIHFPHKISPILKACASSKEVANILTHIISPNVKCLQTMLFMKAPGKKGQSWHQDEYYIPTRDRSLTGVWIAMEDAKLENGCLWVIPGSHKDGFIRKRIDNLNQEFADIDVADIEPYGEEDYFKVEVSAGSAIIFDGYLLHMSLQNKSKDRFRRALVAHYASAESMLPWDQDGRINFTHDFRDIFMVSGIDPYAYKGTEDLSKAFVRPDELKFNTEAHRSVLKLKTSAD